MEIDYEPFLDRSNIYGEVRWRRSIGKALNASAEHGLTISYIFGQNDFPGIRHPRTWEESTADEYVVRYWGPGIVVPNALSHGIHIGLAPGVAWESAEGVSYRFVDRPSTPFDAPRPSIYRMETVHVVGRNYAMYRDPPVDLAVLVGG